MAKIQKMSATRQASPIDALVGRQIRLRRNGHGLNLETVASAIGCSVQQLRKYETGENRISAGMLARVARAFECAPADFFVGFQHIDDFVDVPVLKPGAAPAPAAAPLSDDPDVEALVSCARSINEQQLAAFLDALTVLVSNRARD